MGKFLPPQAASSYPTTLRRRGKTDVNYNSNVISRGVPEQTRHTGESEVYSFTVLDTSRYQVQSNRLLLRDPPLGNFHTGPSHGRLASGLATPPDMWWRACVIRRAISVVAPPRRPTVVHEDIHKRRDQSLLLRVLSILGLLRYWGALSNPDMGDHRGVVVSLLASYQSEPRSIPSVITPGFSHVAILPDNAAGRRVFSGIFRFIRPYIPAFPHTHLTSLPSALRTTMLRELDVRNELFYTSAIAGRSCPREREIGTVEVRLVGTCHRILFGSSGAPPSRCRVAEMRCRLSMSPDVGRLLPSGTLASVALQKLSSVCGFSFVCTDWRDIPKIIRRQSTLVYGVYVDGQWGKKSTYLPIFGDDPVDRNKLQRTIIFAPPNCFLSETRHAEICMITLSAFPYTSLKQILTDSARPQTTQGYIVEAVAAACTTNLPRTRLDHRLLKGDIVEAVAAACTTNLPRVTVSIVSNIMGTEQVICNALLCKWGTGCPLDVTMVLIRGTNCPLDVTMVLIRGTDCPLDVAMVLVRGTDCPLDVTMVLIRGTDCPLDVTIVLISNLFITLLSFVSLVLGRGNVVVRLLASHLYEPASIPRGVTPRFSHFGILLDDAWSAGFIGDLPFPPTMHSGTAPCTPHFLLVGSQNPDVKSRPNISTSLSCHENEMPER
ncbi:hypothetical protein PR048_027669 [Dryococelus australis]|uniref:Uncharacterized protein n=1 Tax=Dryococelus australis TaxID=614101 RepID=A0ABQ9GH50_9NEOP|nr:hypothetical protein PR048_027669 [Dryococelus australis]